MIILVAGLLLFFGVHSVRIFADDWRTRQITANPNRWRALYSVASLVGFGLIIWGWGGFRGEAPQLYDVPEWGRLVAAVLLWVAFVALAAAYSPTGYIKSVLKHPMLTAIILWALAHLLANGDGASLLLFGAFLLYAVMDRIAVIPRGDPGAGAVSTRGDIIALAVGTVAYLVVAIWLHQVLFGVPPMPG